MRTDLESFHATLEHRRPGRVLYHANFTPDLKARVCDHIGTNDFAAHYGFMSRQSLPIRRPAAVAEPDVWRYYKGEDLPEGTVIQNYAARIPAGFYHFTKVLSPLRNATSLRDIEEFPLDDMSDWDFSYMKRIADDAHAQGKVVVGVVGHIYETAWQIRGLEQFMMDIYEHPSWAECLIGRLAEVARLKALAFARAGADYIHCGDDVASQQSVMFPIDTWRSLLHAPWRRIWAEARSVNPGLKVWYHSDGAIAEYVNDLIDAGIDMLNPVQPECVDLAALHQRYGDRLTFDGAIGTQTTMPFGTADDVRARVRDLIERFGQQGGLILSPTHILEPEVPLENIDAFAEACREYGTFD